MNRFTELTLFPWGEIRSRRTIKLRDPDAGTLQRFLPVSQSRIMKGVRFRHCPSLRMDWSRQIDGAMVSFRLKGKMLQFGVVLSSLSLEAQRIARRIDQLLIRIGHRTGREPQLPAAEILQYAPCVATVVLETMRPYDLERTVAFEAALNLAAAYFWSVIGFRRANSTDMEV